MPRSLVRGQKAGITNMFDQGISDRDGNYMVGPASGQSNVATALALPSDDLLAMVIKRADERPIAEIVTRLNSLHQRANIGFTVWKTRVLCATVRRK
jgi:hypothetical protein